MTSVVIPARRKARQQPESVVCDAPGARGQFAGKVRFAEWNRHGVTRSGMCLWGLADRTSAGWEFLVCDPVTAGTGAAQMPQPRLAVFGTEAEAKDWNERHYSFRRGQADHPSAKAMPRVVELRLYRVDGGGV